jgi:hypothetical protein
MMSYITSPYDLQRSLEDRVAELEGEHMHHLQQQEYVRNIVFKYMLGAHQEELARVIATVLEFEPKQKQKVIYRESQLPDCVCPHESQADVHYLGPRVNTAARRGHLLAEHDVT